MPNINSISSFFDFLWNAFLAVLNSENWVIIVVFLLIGLFVGAYLCRLYYTKINKRLREKLEQAAEDKQELISQRDTGSKRLDAANKRLSKFLKHEVDAAALEMEDEYLPKDIEDDIPKDGGFPA